MMIDSKIDTIGNTQDHHCACSYTKTFNLEVHIISQSRDNAVGGFTIKGQEVAYDL
jgi:hypothetical protein